MHEGHDDREHHDFYQGQPDVVGREEKTEVVAVRSLRLAFDPDHRKRRCHVRSKQADQVQRDHRDERRDHSGGDQVPQRGNRHDFERVDFLGDPHRSELRGESGSDLGCQGDCGNEWCHLASIRDGGHHAGQRCEADEVESAVALESDLGTCEERDREDHDDAAAAGEQGARTECHLGDETGDFTPIALEGCRNRGDDTRVERELIAESTQAVDGPRTDPLGTNCDGQVHQ